jgi:hypothetical protein
MKNPLIDFNAPQWRQGYLPLTRTVVFDDCRRLVCIPDRMSAEDERSKIKRQHGAAMIAAKITKSGTGKTGTYTLAYTLRDIRTENVF